MFFIADIIYYSLSIYHFRENHDFEYDYSDYLDLHDYHINWLNWPKYYTEIFTITNSD
jgi:hypothetical protein